METNFDSAATAAAMMPFMVIAAVIGVLMIVALWKIFVKAGEPGWASIIPLYNVVVEFRIAGLNPWLCLLLLVPIANIVIAIMLAFKLGERFGKGGAWSFFLLVLFPIVGYLILGFGKDAYRPPVLGGR